MIQTHDGLSLMYDTPDVPAPAGDQLENTAVSMTVMLKPISPSNAVTLRYRIDGGLTKYLYGVAGPNNYRENTQSFRVSFPNLPLGQLIEYAVIGSSAGRQVPNAGFSREFPHSFRIARRASPNPPDSNQQEIRSPGDQQSKRYELVGEFLARFSINIEPPRIAGPTPDGIRVMWNAASGEVAGPRLNAKVLQGADWMLIRTDGTARVDVAALLETFDGGRIVMNYSGLIELGENGYQQFLSNSLHETLRVWTTPRFSTGHEAYKWLNRRQCISVGEVSIDYLTYVYDVYQLK